jgi:hypothetical protein
MTTARAGLIIRALFLGILFEERTMSSPVERFWDQYKENVHYARRNRKYKFARLFWAFFVTLLIAPICYGIRWLTDSNGLAAGVGIVGAIGGVIVWWIIEAIWRSASDSKEAMAADVMPAQFAGPSSGPQPAQPAWQPAASPHDLAEPKRSGGGVLVALAAVFAVLALSCCGGGIALVAIGSRFANDAAQARPAAGPGDIAFPAPTMPGPGSPFGDFHRQHQDQMNELRRQQDAMRRQHEEMLRDLKSGQPRFGP